MRNIYVTARLIGSMAILGTIKHKYSIYTMSLYNTLWALYLQIFLFLFKIIVCNDAYQFHILTGITGWLSSHAWPCISYKLGKSTLVGFA